VSKNRALLDGVLIFGNVVVFCNIDVVFSQHLIERSQESVRHGGQKSGVNEEKFLDRITG